jgi:prepilin peptidase CpaA
MPLHLDLIPLAGFTALMAAAAFEDLRRLVIPNAVIAGLCVLWPFHLAAAPGVAPAAVFAATGCGLAIFLAGALLFSRGLIGGGDVKLLAAATLWAGPGMTPALLAVTAVFGGVLSLAALSVVALRAVLTPAATAAIPVSRVPVPYGVAIAAAALIVTIPPNLSH